LLYAIEGWGIFLLMFTFLSFLFVGFTSVAERETFTHSVGRAWNLMGANYSQVFVLHMVLLLILTTFLTAMSAPLIYMYLNVFKWNFAKGDTWINDVLYFIELLIKMLAFYMTLPIIAACAGYLYYSLAEILDASHLRQAIDSFGVSKSKYTRK
jgi:hypothetical protein